MRPPTSARAANAVAAAAIAAPAMAARPGTMPAATIAIATAATEPSASPRRVALNATPSPSARAGAIERELGERGPAPEHVAADDRARRVGRLQRREGGGHEQRVGDERERPVRADRGVAHDGEAAGGVAAHAEPVGHVGEAVVVQRAGEDRGGGQRQRGAVEAAEQRLAERVGGGGDDADQAADRAATRARPRRSPSSGSGRRPTGTIVSRPTAARASSRALIARSVSSPRRRRPRRTSPSARAAGRRARRSAAP